MYAVGFLAGCWSLMQLSQLPSLGLLLAISLGCFLVAGGCREVKRVLPGWGEWRCSRLPMFIGCCFIGLFWQAWHCQGLLANRLSVAQEGKELIVVGTICDIPTCDEQHCSFTVKSERLSGSFEKTGLYQKGSISQSRSFRKPRKTLTQANPKAVATNRATEVKKNKTAMTFRVSWYGVARPLHVGERWQLAVRLKRPRGTLNPGGFDFEAWSWQHHLSGKGNVNNKGANRFLGLSRGYQFLQWREKCLDACRALLIGEPLGGVITALNLGWTQDIPYSQRIIVQRTGTAHLLAISGLHVGMVAGLVAWLLRWLWSMIPRVTEYLPAPTVAAFGAILAALIYSEMAGFACSTQRACVMCALLFLPKIAHRHMTVKTALFRAVWVVLLWDPCVVQSSGFWLSFMAVFVLVYARYTKDLGRGWQHIEAQWVCLIGLLPLSCWYFHQVSLVSIVANMIAIPVVGFIVLPLVLLGTALALKQAFWAKVIFVGAMKILMGLGVGLSWLSRQEWAVWSYSFTHWWEFLVVTSGCALLVFTQKNWRWVGLIGVVPMVLPNTFPVQKGQFKLSVLDVGQGLATVVTTRHHTLIYDTGAKFSPQLDCGQQIVIPYLILEKIRKVDALVVSHGDNDHAGGAMAILTELPVKKFYTSALEHFSQKLKNKSQLRSQQASPSECHSGIHWEWDGVKFEFLHPLLQSEFKSNDGSCVLKVSSEYGSVLFPGDIEKTAEHWLGEYQKSRLASTVLIVPHHGSKTSSTQAFIENVHPEVAIMSYGYRNRYRHPHADVVDRYQQAGTKILNTMSSGAITYTLGASTAWQLYRQSHHEFWRVFEE
jgi:competence protein ComEC